MKDKKITDEQKEEMRTATIDDSFGYLLKPRFGLFGAPSSCAIGDNGEYKKTKCKKDDEGGVITQPRNFYGGPLKFIGHLKAEETVHDPGFICNATGDPYKVPSIAGLRKFPKDTFLKGNHEKDFCRAKNCTFNKGQRVATYEYKCTEPPKRKPVKNEDGEVPTAPIGFLIKPMPKGRTMSTYFMKTEYKGDDYNAKKLEMNKELKDHHDAMYKMLGDDFKPFSQRCHRKGFHGNFNTIRSILAEDPLPEIPKNKKLTSKYKKPMPSTAFEHDKDFKPAGCKMSKTLQFQETITRFPEYICSPPLQLQKKEPVDDDKKGWCVTYKERTSPSPSVALNIRNLKTSFPGVLKN